MPRYHLSNEKISEILLQFPKKLVRYCDDELPNLLLEQRTNGKATWYYRYRAEGKVRFLHIGKACSISAVQARELAYQMHTSIKNGIMPKTKIATSSRTSPMLNDFIVQQYLPHIQARKRSWQLDLRLLRLYILPYFGTRAMHSIQRAEVEKWQTALKEKGLALSSCNRIIAVFKVLFSVAVRWNIVEINENPCRTLAPFPNVVLRERYLSATEMQRLTHYLDTHIKSSFAPFIKLLLLTGARKSELLTARWEHIHLQEHRLTVPLSKSGKARHIPLSDAAVALIASLPRKNNSPWLFPAHNPSRHLRSPQYTWTKIRQELGLPDVRLHDLRHSFASVLVNSGYSLYTVQQILGHYDPKVTMRYAHLAPSSLINAANSVSKILSSAEKEE